MENNLIPNNNIDSNESNVDIEETYDTFLQHLSDAVPIRSLEELELPDRKSEQKNPADLKIQLQEL